MLLEHYEQHPSVHYDFGKKIGEGSFGSVKVGTDKRNGQKLAVKTVPKSLLEKEGCGVTVNQKNGRLYQRENEPLRRKAALRQVAGDPQQLPGAAGSCQVGQASQP